MKVTQWFDGHSKPKRKGVYERDIAHLGKRFSHWDGRKWSGYCDSVETAYRLRHTRSTYQCEWWRGLAEKPKDSQAA